MFPLYWQGSEMMISLSKSHVTISSSRPVTLWLNAKPIVIDGEYKLEFPDMILPVFGTATTERGKE